MNSIKTLAVAFVFASAMVVQPAWAQMPQTDVQLVEAVQGQGSDKALSALEAYYDLHVSEVDVQLTREHNTGAFLAARRAESEGDTAEAARQMEVFEGTKAALADARSLNSSLRQKLAAMVGVDFADDLIMAPDAPFEKPVYSDVSAELATALDDAWANVERARENLKDVRLSLLETQERYDIHRDVSIGDAMRAMTKAEVDMTRAACDLRMAVAKIAASAKQPIGGALSNL